MITHGRYYPNRDRKDEERFVKPICNRHCCPSMESQTALCTENPSMLCSSEVFVQCTSGHLFHFFMGIECTGSYWNDLITGHKRTHGKFLPPGCFGFCKAACFSISDLYICTQIKITCTPKLH
jgi:hypothetical protein